MFSSSRLVSNDGMNYPLEYVRCNMNLHARPRSSRKQVLMGRNFWASKAGIEKEPRWEENKYQKRKERKHVKRLGGSILRYTAKLWRKRENVLLELYKEWGQSDDQGVRPLAGRERMKWQKNTPWVKVTLSLGLPNLTGICK